MDAHGLVWLLLMVYSQKTFKDKAKDSRYDGTFTTVYRGNWSTNGKDWTTVIGANGMEVTEGEPLLSSSLKMIPAFNIRMVQAIAILEQEL